jgi:hypothetical protein
MIDRGKSPGPHVGNRPPCMVLAATATATTRQDPIASVPVDFPLDWNEKLRYW